MAAFDELPHEEKLKRLEAVARAAVPAFALPPQSKVRMINLSENATYKVETPDGRRFAMRVHRGGYHSKNAIASELAWIEALRAGSPVVTPIPVPGANGELIQTVSIPGMEPRQVVLFAWEEGAEPPEDELLGPFETLGFVTAQMHAFTRKWRTPQNFERLTWDFEGAFGPKAHWGSWRAGMGLDTEKTKLFSRVVDLIGERLERFGKSSQRFGLVHCDMRLANLMIDGKTTKVIDFDDCGLSWYLYDCATALSFIEHRPDVPDLVDAWVRGYRRALELPDVDVAEIPTFIMFRRMLLIAWIGSHAETDLAQSMGVPYTNDTVALAEDYLKRFGPSAM